MALYNDSTTMRVSKPEARLIRQATSVRKKRDSRYNGLLEGGELNAKLLSGLMSSCLGVGVTLPPRVQFAWQVCHKMARACGPNPSEDDFRDAYNYLIGAYESFLKENKTHPAQQAEDGPPEDEDPDRYPPNTSRGERQFLEWLYRCEPGDEVTFDYGEVRPFSLRDYVNTKTKKYVLLSVIPADSHLKGLARAEKILKDSPEGMSNYYPEPEDNAPCPTMQDRPSIPPTQEDLRLEKNGLSSSSVMRELSMPENGTKS